MPREKEDYRANLERLNELHPNHEMLTVPETMQVMGYRSKEMQEERFNTICLLVGIGLGCYTFIEFFKMLV